MPFGASTLRPSRPNVLRMDRGRLLSALASQRAYCERRSPLYAAVLRELEADAAHSPAWLARLEDAWRQRRFAVDWEVAHLLLAAMHYAALAGEADELAAVYPSCGGQACRFVAEQGAVVPAGWNRRHPILTRAGLDLRPRRVADWHDRLWLKACVWADDLPRLERLDLAIEVFLGKKNEIRLERCAFADAPDWLLGALRPNPAAGLLVFNAIGTVYLDDEGYAHLRRGMARALAPWQGRAVWVEYERARERPAGPLELALHRPAGGGLRTEVIASGPPRPDRMTLHARRSVRGEPLVR